MNLEDYLRFAAAIIFVLGMIMLISWALRHFGLGAPTGAAARHRRVAVVEVAPIDAKRRLVLVRRDGVEHLILLAPAGDLLIEAGIRPDARVKPEPEAAS